MLEPVFRSTTEVPKAWGKEVIIANNDLYCGKLLCMLKGARFSVHYHLTKTETFHVLSGRGWFKYIDLTSGKHCTTRILLPGNTIDIPRGCPHQIAAEEDMVIVEVSTHHSDDDSFRIEPSVAP